MAYPSSGKLMFLLGSLLLAALVAGSYATAVNGGWIWDDRTNILDNPLVQKDEALREASSMSVNTPLYRPLVRASLWIDGQMFGRQTDASPVGFHVVNLVLHAMASVLLWRVLVRLAVPGALLAAALFAVHPVHMQSVAWISGRVSVLAGVFYFATALSFLQFALRPGRSGLADRAWYVAALALFVPALLSSPLTVTLPVTLLVVLWWKKPSLTRADLLALLPMVAMALVFALASAWIDRGSGDPAAQWAGSIGQRIVVAGWAVGFYLRTLVAPFGLSFIYPAVSLSPVMIAWPIGVLVALAALWVLTRWLGRGPAAAGLVFVITLFPVLGLFNFRWLQFAPVADHFQYLAAGSILAAIAAAAARWLGPPLRRLHALAGPVAAAVPVLALGTLTALGCLKYRDEETLWKATLARDSDCWVAHLGLGKLYLIDAAAHPRSSHAMDRLSSAVSELTEALIAQPGHANLYYLRGLARTGKGLYGPAEADFTEAVKRNPRLVEAYVHRAQALIGLGGAGSLRAARESLEQALQINSSNAELHFQSALLSSLSGDFKIAVEHSTRALDLGYTPRADGLVRRASARMDAVNASYYDSAELDRARDDLEEAIRVDATCASAYEVRAYLRMQRRSEDREWADKAWQDIAKCRELKRQPGGDGYKLLVRLTGRVN